MGDFPGRSKRPVRRLADILAVGYCRENCATERMLGLNA